jgi:hypothetical protein
MKNAIRLTTLLFLVVAFASFDAKAQNGGGRLAGTWDATVTIYNCATGAPIRQFASVGTFHQGGTFNGITSGPPPPPAAARTPEVGVWRHDKENGYTLRFKAFLLDATGNPIGYQVLTHSIELDSDNLNYVSDGGVQVFNMAGTQIGSGCSSSVATRMVLD